MKKVVSLVCLAAVLACSKDETTVPTQLNLSNLSLSLDENPTTGQVISKINATTNQGSIQYKLVNESPAGALALNANSGELTVKDKTLFDFETHPKITATAKVTSGSVSKTASITIDLNDLKIPQNGLIGFYECNGDATDSSTQQHHGTANALVATTDRRGVSNKALDFSSENAYIDLGDVDYLHGVGKQFAFSFWMKPTTSLDNSTIVSKLSQASSCNETEQEFILRIRNGKISVLFYGNTDGNRRSYTGDTLFQLDQWYQVVVNYDGSAAANDGHDRLSVTINGVTENFVAEDAAGSFPFDIEDTDSHLGLGNRLNSEGNICVDRRFLGTLDDIAIYNRVLTTAEINTIWEDSF